MDRYRVEVAIQPAGVPRALYAYGHPRLLVGLGLTGGGTSRVRFGSRTAELLFAPAPALPPDRLELSPALAEALSVAEPISLTANRTGHREVTLGPLVGFAVSPPKLAKVLAGKRDTAYCRYERHAREAGITLIFFSPAEVDLENNSVVGYAHRCDGVRTCRWTARRYPLPRVIYERCFGKEGREASLRLRRMAAELGVTVVNPLRDPAKSRPDEPPSATYLGSPFGVHSLIQRDASGSWAVTALAARMGQQAAPADRVLRHAFPDRWETVLADLERFSLQQAVGSCVELGLELGVKPDGTVKLLEVNPRPLRLNLDRLRDPLVSERIYRWPVHAAASLELGSGMEFPAGPADGGAPVVGVLLGESPMHLLHGRMQKRFRQMVREAAAAGVRLCFIEAAEVDVRTGQVRGWREENGQWTPRTLPLPDVIYHRGGQAGELLRALCTQHGTVLINRAEAISKKQVDEALASFPATASLPAAEGGIVELRAILQKNGDGEWTVPVVLNRSGRRVTGPEATTAAVASTAMLAAEALEARFGLLGELGIDIYVDREGRPWVLEADTAPSHPSLADLPEPLVRNPLRYAVWLVNRARQGRRSGLSAPVRLT